MYDEEMQDKDDENAIMTPLAARLWNKGATYAWADVDIQETQNEFVFSFDIPEALRNNIKIWVSDNRLFVSGDKSGNNGRNGNMEPENENNRYSRNFRLPSSVDVDSIIARFIDGVLIVIIPKSSKAKISNINLN